MVADWPGYFPNGAEMVRLLVGAGADPAEPARAGIRPRAEELLAADPPPAADDINEAFWQACRGGQRRMAEYLLARGADINTSPDYAAGRTPVEAAAEVDTRHQAVISWLREQGASEG